MTTKQRHVMHWTWVALDDLCRAKGRMVTAGELAGELGLSRNTAHKRLEDMVRNEAIEVEKMQRGKVVVTRYGTGAV